MKAVVVPRKLAGGGVFNGAVAKFDGAWGFAHQSPCLILPHPAVNEI